MINIYSLLADKYNLDEEVIERVTKSQFLFTRDMIEQGELESVHLHHLGKFCIKPKIRKFLEEKNAS